MSTFRLKSILYEALWICWQTVCDEIVGWGKKKRDTNNGDVIDSITCGTTLRVKTPMVDAHTGAGNNFYFIVSGEIRWK